MWRVNTTGHPAAVAVRRFSEAAGRGRGGRGGRGVGHGGGPGRGRENFGGRGQAFQRFRRQQGLDKGEHEKLHRGGPRKENFAKAYLEPAAKSQLLGRHESGIPRLASRKGKSHAVHDDFPGTEAKEALDQAFLSASGQELEASIIKGDARSLSETVPAFRIVEGEFIDDEDEYDEIETYGFDPLNHPDIYKDEEGYTVFLVDPEEDQINIEDLEDPNQAMASVVDGNRSEITEQSEPFNPEEMFFDRDLFDFEAPRPEDLVPQDIANRLLPLNIEGDGYDDFLAAQYEHPSKYAEVRRYNHHPESLREAKPIFPKYRKQPSDDFVTSHKRFLYVSGLPCHVDEDGQPGDLENPIHRLEVSKRVADILGVKAESVSPASMTSAFVGYKKKEDLYNFFKQGPKYSILDRPLKASLYTVSEGDNSGFSVGDGVLKLDDVPANMTTGRFLHVFFPKGSELEVYFGPLTLENIKKVTGTTYLVRLKSKEHASKALSSPGVEQRLQELGHHVARFFRARRQLTHGGFTGPAKGQAYKVRGKKLVVEGDTPSTSFFQSHAGVIQLRNVNPSISKEDFANFFQKFCADRRDVYGSVEFVTCSEGERTDIVYVGFDRFGEAEAFLKTCHGVMNMGKGPIIVRLVKEAYNPITALREARPERNEDELLDSLNNWERFVDAEKVRLLVAKGITKEVVADVFRTMRFHNRSYGALDWGIKAEKLDKNSESGDQIRKTMQEYVDALLEAAADDEDGITMEDLLTIPEEDWEEGDISGKQIMANDQLQIAKIASARKGYFLGSY